MGVGVIRAVGTREKIEAGRTKRRRERVEKMLALESEEESQIENRKNECEKNPVQ